jgi:hypothetical protein
LEYEKRVVAFIDVLGWSQAVTDSIHDAGLRDRMENSLSALCAIVVDQIKDVAEWERPVPDDQAGLFSDSIIISYPFHDPRDLTRLIRRVSEYQGLMLLEGFPLRGGNSRPFDRCT